MNVPSHIAIVPDGNRRLAKRLLKEPWKGHEMGVRKVHKVFDWCKELKIRNITLYALSIENINKRPKAELSFLFALAKKEIDDILKPGSFVHKNKVRMSFFGRISVLPDYLQESIRRAEEKTKKYSSYHINFAIAYGGRQEILDAVNKISLDRGVRPGKVTESVFRKYLQTNGSGDPDLIIRTGGEKRLSNFLSFQSAYSELVFTDFMWPELSKKDFFRIIKDFSDRERRFGK
jgi:tritrans,polycis-undecaprenyl-diphosphate synthase [geranylgeranyl-diphosphate specific]